MTFTDDPDYFPNTDYERGYADGRASAAPRSLSDLAVVNDALHDIAMLRSVIASKEDLTDGDKADLDRTVAALRAVREREAAPRSLSVHPGEKHVFRVECEKCGAPGTLNVALLGPDEGYFIGPRGDLAAPTPEDPAPVTRNET